MFLLLLLLVTATAIGQTVRCYISFQRNLAAAKASGIPYVTVPVYSVAMTWLVTQKLWTPFLRRLPRRWTGWWLDMTLENAPWDLLYGPFAEHGSDTLLIVAPGKCELRTADAAVISQITARRSDFPKPLEVYGSLKIYGNNVVTTEGQIWKAHRKITSPPFSEKNNHIVWTEATFQTQSMLDSWMDNGARSSTIATLGEDCMILALHVISRAGFGRRMQWPERNSHDASRGSPDPLKSEDKTVELDEGHSMTYSETLSTLLKNIIWILLIPKPILKRLPFEKPRMAYQAYFEWGMYLKEMYQAKQSELSSSSQQEVAQDLLGALVNGGGSTGAKDDPTTLEKGETVPAQLSKEDIIGNAFIFILAGHETTSNSIHFSIIYLALHPSAQRALQADLDRILGDKPSSQWDYETYFAKLLNSMANAVLSEELRLIPPVVTVPKCVREQPQQLTVNGKECTVPADTYIAINILAAHRNPNSWPIGLCSSSENCIRPDMNTDNDLEEFKPERWFAHKSNDSEEGDLNDRGDSHLDTPTTLYRPPRGAYIPFSEGPRSCLGRRFAQVKVMAVFATIFSSHSVELALDDFASEEQLKAMSEGERRAVWEKARAEAFRKLREDMYSLLTLQMHGDIKVRFTKRDGR